MEAGSFVQCAASQMLRCWSVPQRKCLFTRQPSEETGEQISYLPPWRRGAWDIYGIEKQGGLRRGERWLEVGKMWGSWYSMPAYLSYMFLQGIHVQKWRYLAWSEGGVFTPLMSKDHSLDPCAGPVLGLLVPTSLSQLELDRSRLQALENNLSPRYYSDPFIRGVIYRGPLRSQKIIKTSLVSEGRLQGRGF